jgi:hypothetical protein
MIFVVVFVVTEEKRKGIKDPKDFLWFITLQSTTKDTV